MAPADVRFGRATQLQERRAQVLAAAYAERPEHFIGGMPRPPQLPTAARINRPEESAH
jgi:putative transposase